VPFACPGCGAAVLQSPERWALRCPSCRRVIRARPADASGEGTRAYDVEITGQPETRRRIELPWTSEEAARLRRWLLWSTVLTLALVAILFAAARWAAG
jgi:DNA-directed RNA polymerase subunit RPC12/RpoP